MVGSAAARASKLSIDLRDASKAPAVSPEALDVYDPVTAATAWAVLLGAAAVLTLLGMWLFTRYEPKDDV